MMQSRWPDAPAKTKIAVIGSARAAESWSRALRCVEGVAAGYVAPPWPYAPGAGVEAVAFASPAPALPSTIESALLARHDVLVATPVAMRSRTVLELDELAHRQGRILLFDTPGLGDDALAFARKMTCGPHALWPPRYMRSVRTAGYANATIDEMAIDEIATLLSLADDAPATCSAVAPAADRTSALDAAMVSLSYANGMVATLALSRLEAELRRELTIACDGRSIVVHPGDSRSPLQIQATARHRGLHHGAEWGETVSEYPLAAGVDRQAAVAALFSGAIRRRDLAATNAGAIAHAALVWETARASIARGGERLSLRPEREARGQRPALQLIHGGGRISASPPPHLTLVSRRS